MTIWKSSRKLQLSEADDENEPRYIVAWRRRGRSTILEKNRTKGRMKTTGDGGGGKVREHVID